VIAEEEQSSEVAETALEGTDAPVEVDEAPPPASAPSSAVIAIGQLTRWSLVNGRAILLIALVIATAGLAVGLFFFQYRPDRQVDDAAAQQAVRAASDGAVALLSYSSDNLDRDIADAKSYLTGDFLAYYTKFTTEVVAPAVRQKHLKQKSVVTRAAVSKISPTSAVVLAYVNESVTSPDRKDPLVTPSIVSVTLEKVDGSWLISKLDPVG
jgi:Mce-associated membrane protein